MNKAKNSLLCDVIPQFLINVESCKNIEQLKKGDLVRTYCHGYVPIKLIGKQMFRNNNSLNVESMYKINDLYELDKSIL
jgi:hypothetical protein